MSVPGALTVMKQESASFSVLSLSHDRRENLGGMMSHDCLVSAWQLAYQDMKAHLHLGQDQNYPVHHHYQRLGTHGPSYADAWVADL
jgi:hypothetical protein